MAIIQNINVSTPNDGLGDTLRDSQIKANDNFAELNSKKVEAVPGKGLSENDFTTAEKSKLAGIEAGAEVNVQSDWNQADPDQDDYIKNKPTILDPEIFELIENKQNDLSAYDGAGLKYVGKDGFDATTRNFLKVAAKTGLLSKADSFNLTALDNSTARISAVESCLFWNEIFAPLTSPVASIKSFPQKDYPLTELVTATGGNVNSNPIVADGKHIRYLGYDKNGNVYSSIISLMPNLDLFQIGYVTVLKSGASVTFLDGVAGPRNVFPQPSVASNTEFDKVAAITTNVSISGNSTANFNTSDGTIIGISVNWKSAQNPSNSNPIDVYNVTGQSTPSFVVIDPNFLSSTSALTAQNVWTALDGGIAINQSFYNTSTLTRGTMNNGTAAVARIMMGLRGGLFLQLGEYSSAACYSSLAAAKDNIFSQRFTDAIIPPGVAIEIGRIAYAKGATNFLDPSQVFIVNTAGSAGGGSSSIPPVSDATVATKGILKLAGDFDATSTADVPVIKSASETVAGKVELATNAETVTGTDNTRAVHPAGLANKLAGYQLLLTNPITGTGTSGQVSFWNGTTAQSGDNAFFWDNTNKRLGIGTSSPSSKLEVNGSIFSNTTSSLATGVVGDGNTALRLFSSGNSAYGIGVSQSNGGIDYMANQSVAVSHRFYGGTENNVTPNLIMSLKGNGVVLVGTTTDNGVDKLQVNGNISAVAATNSNHVVIKSQLDATKPYTIYTALISQTGTSAPTVTILENTLGNVVWTRSSTGFYVGTLTNAFVTNKTFQTISHNDTQGLGNTQFFPVLTYGGTSTLFLSTISANGTYSDDILSDCPIEIRVYN